MQFKTKPRQHQLDTFELAKDQIGWACFWEVGSGKTWEAIQLARWQYNLAGRILPTLIFTPPRPVPGWKKQWLEHTNVKPEQVVLLQDSQKERVKAFKEASTKFNNEVIFVTNYESLLMKELFQLFVAFKPGVLVWDESHRLKSQKAQRTKLADELANPYDMKLKRLLPKPNTYMLSGSPVLKDPMDLFMQFKIMDGGKTFGHNIWAFRARYFRDRNAGMPKDRYFPKWELMTKEKVNFDAEGEIKRLMSSMSSFVSKAQCLDLPPETDEIIEVTMNKEQERLYKEMKNELLTFYNSKACVASLAITKALRMMQILTGYIPVQNPGEDDEQILMDIKDNPRIEKYKEWLEEMLEMGQSVLVWAVFKHNYKALRTATQEVFDKLKLKNASFVECHGEISSKQQALNLEKFRDDPDCLVFLGHPKSGGIGVNELMKAGVDLTYSRDFSLESYIQSRGRNHRDGTEKFGHKKIVHYNMVTQGTIDEAALKKLVNKEDMSDRLLADLVAEIQVQKN